MEKVTNFEELVNVVAEKAGISQKQARKVLGTAKDVIIESIKAGNDFHMVGLVNFKRVHVKGHDYAIGEKTGHTEDHDIVKAKASVSLYK